MLSVRNRGGGGVVVPARGQLDPAASGENRSTRVRLEYTSLSRIRAPTVITMMPLHELLSRIRWDPAFGRGEFRLGYLDHLRGGLVYVPLNEVRQASDSLACFELADAQGQTHTIPYHRVKEVWKNGELIWRRTR